MLQPKIEAMVREFPFLGQFVNLQKCKDIKVQRIDEDLLKKTIYNGTSESGRYPYHGIYILNKAGGLLAKVGVKKESQRKPRWWNPASWLDDDETVLGAINRVGSQVDEISFIIFVNGFGKEVVLYKSPKDQTVSEWLEERVKENRTAIEQAD